MHRRGREDENLCQSVPMYNPLTCIHPTHSAALTQPASERLSKENKAIQKGKTKHGFGEQQITPKLSFFFFLLFHWEVKLNRIGFLHICQTNIPGDSTAPYKLHNWTHRKGWEAHSSLRGCLWRVGDTAAIGRVTVPVQWPTSPQLSLLLGVEL